MRKLATKLSFFFLIAFVFMGVGAISNDLSLTTIAYAEEIQEPTATATGACGTNATWNYYEDISTLEITGSGSVNTYNVGATPWYSYADNIKKIIVNDGITGISSGLFSGMSTLEELTIPFVNSYNFGFYFGTQSYTNSYSVRKYYYQNYASTPSYESTDYYIPGNLRKVSVTKGSYIPDCAFVKCTSITEIKLNEGITSIGKSAFEECTSLEKINLPSTLTDIRLRAFYNCTKLNNVEIPGTVTAIGDYAFWNCKALHTQIGENVKSIGSYAFSGCSSLDNQTFPATLTSIGSGAFKNCTAFTEINIPQNVMSIGDSAFSGCSSVTAITLEEGVKTIGSDAFCNINKVTKLTIPTTVTSMGSGLFSGMSALEELTIPFVNSYNFGFYFGTQSYTNSYSVRKYYYQNYASTPSYESTDYYIPGNLRKVSVTKGSYIPDCAFVKCTSITEIKLNEGITSIGKSAFEECTSLEKINLPSTLTDIRLRAFYNCTKLNNVEIPGTVTAIGDYAFWNCKTATVHILMNTTNITVYQHTFTNVPIVKYFDYYSYTNGNNTFYYNVFDGNAVLQKTVTADTDLTLPTALGGYTLVKVGNMGVANCTTLTSIVIPANISELSDYAFSGCTGLVTVTIPATCLHVGNYAFNGCTSITTTTIAEGVKYVGDYAFFNCKNLQEIVIPDSCEYLGQGAFYNCSGMKSATIGITVPTIEDYTFMNCSSLETIVVGLKVTSIGNYAFKNCTSIGRITLRKGLVSIGDGAFMSCSAISKVTLAATITNIGSYAFYGCSSLGSVTIPAAVTTIRQSTFENCTSLATASYNGTVEVIENRAFYGTAVSAFEFKNGLARLGSDAFAKTSLTNVVLPNSLTVIGQHVFDHCQLTSISMPSCVKLDTNCIRIFENNGKDMVVTIRFVNDTVLDDYLLYNSGAKQVVLENGIEKIGNYTFAKNIFTEIDLPETLTDIGNNAFYLCENLKSIYVPKHVVNIGAFAFSNDLDLTDTYLPDSVLSIGESAFEKINKDLHSELTVHVYLNKGNICDSLFESQHMQFVVVNDYIRTIGNKVFAECSNLKEVSVPDTVQTFGQNNFLNDNSVTLKIRKVDGSIDDHVYQDNLLFVTTVLIEDGISVIGEYAFYNDTSVQVISVPNSVNTIGQYAFYNCNSIKVINIPNGVTAIRSHTFFGCASLENIVTPNSVTLIEDYAFYGCVEAKNLTISNNCKSIGDNAFYNCKSITALEIPSSVTKIGSYAFRSCILITELDFSDNVDDIGECAFYDCNALRIVRLGKRVTELKDRMFYGCVNLTDLYVNAPLSFIDELAFYGAEDVTIHCGRDDYMIAFFEENGLNYEINESLVYEYKVVFKDADGNILSSALYKYGETVTEPATPQKAADNTYTYTFESWDKEVVTVGGNAVYTATYTPTYIEYAVIFKNYDGTELSSTTYHYGDEIIIPDTPIRPADNTYTYEFAGWDNEVVACAGNVTYTATYTPVYIEYTVIFQNYDGTELSKTTYHYGDEVTAPDTPSKPADNTYTYDFAGWDKEVVACAGDATYTATYDSVFIEYTVIFQNYDGAELSSTTYHYGDEVVVPETPSKPADNTYTYEFAGWDNEVIACAGNVTYTAIYDSVYIEYTVIFKNYDGSELSKATYHYGDEVTAPETPSKPADNTYTYEFAGWDNEVVACAGDATYTATYNSVYIEYTVVFKNIDGTEISKTTYHYGDEITVPEDPSKEADLVGTYTFTGWDSEITVCEGNKVYTATYDIVYIDYTVVFKNYDGEEISRETYHYGDTIELPETPVKPADNTYTYEFVGWGTTVDVCEGNAEYTAEFTPVYIEYTVIFKNYDGTELSKTTYHYGDEVIAPETPSKPADNTYTYEFIGWDNEVIACAGDITYTAIYDPVYIEYTVIFKNYDGTELSSTTYHYGDEVVAPETPSKPADNTYTYEFAGWDKEVIACAGDTTYTATYDPVYIEYTVIFKNYDGTELSKTTYHYGDEVVAPETPAKPADNTYTYEFAGWDKAIVACAGDATYTATYDSVYIEYTVIFKNYDGEELSKTTYHYGDEVTAPDTPSKPADNTYTYKFAGWDNEVVACMGDTTYTAMYDPVYIEYTVKFLDWNGSLLQERMYYYGDTIIPAADPARDNDETYIYTFKGWNKDVGSCTGNMTFTAQYDTAYIEYAVIFKNYDGTVISRKTYHYGDALELPEAPSRSADETYTYRFKEWENLSSTCIGNAEYMAIFEEIYIEYTIIFEDYNGTILSETTYHYGDEIQIPDNPIRPADEVYQYEFAGWDKKVIACVGNETYVATYSTQNLPVKPDDGLSGGAIAGITVASVAVCGGIGFVLYWFVFRKKRKL